MDYDRKTLKLYDFGVANVQKHPSGLWGQNSPAQEAGDGGHNFWLATGTRTCNTRMMLRHPWSVSIKHVKGLPNLVMPKMDDHGHFPARHIE